MSCGEKTPLQPKVSPDEYAIINVILKRSIPSAKVFRDQRLYHYRQLPGLLPTKIKLSAEDLKRQKKSCDNAKATMDAAKLYVVTTRELVSFPADEFEQIRRAKTGDLIRQGLRNVAKVKMIAHLADTKDIEAVTLDTGNIQRVPGYKYIFYDGRFNKSLKKLGPPSYVFSRVKFNRSKTMACIYSQNYCGFLCGSGSFLFLEKAGGVWRIFEEFELWVS